MDVIYDDKKHSDEITRGTPLRKILYQIFIINVIKRNFKYIKHEIEVRLSRREYDYLIDVALKLIETEFGDNAQAEIKVDYVRNDIRIGVRLKAHDDNAYDHISEIREKFFNAECEWVKVNKLKRGCRGCEFVSYHGCTNKKDVLTCEKREKYGNFSPDIFIYTSFEPWKDTPK